MSELITNRDLYLAVLELRQEFGESNILLEEYLIALRALGSRYQDWEAIRLSDFYTLLRDAFICSPTPYDATLGDQYDVPSEQSGYAGWRTTISNQIVDLHEMRLAGVYENDMRYFGLQSPRGGYWVNFDPGSYLECAINGTLGGWQPDDDSGRMYVPGLVATLDENGNIVSMNPEDIPNPIYEVPYVTWDVFQDILRSGQMYE